MHEHILNEPFDVHLGAIILKRPFNIVDWLHHYSSGSALLYQTAHARHRWRCSRRLTELLLELIRLRETRKRHDTSQAPHLVVLEQREVTRVRLEVRRQALRVQQLQAQLLGAGLQRGGSDSVVSGQCKGCTGPRGSHLR